MITGYFLFYAEASIVCISILVIMLVNDKLHSTNQEKQIWFNRTIAAHICYFVSDTFWAAVKSGTLPQTRLSVGLANLMNYILLSVVAYEWFMYAAAAEKMEYRKSRKVQILCAMPIFLTTAVLCVAYASAPLFWLNENAELNDVYYPMMIAVPVFYLLFAFVQSVIQARKAKNRDQKIQFIMIGTYPLGLVMSGVIQLFLVEAPIFCFGCVIMLLTFYIENMQMKVSVDSLTMLNNRGQIDRYMDQIRYREHVVHTAMMIDIDGFKVINDTFGHAEGDRALVLIAEALKEVAERFRAPMFIGRYGGDEFTVFLQSQEGDDLPEQVREAIRQAAPEKERENRLPYHLEVSIGHDTLRDQNDTLEACLARADEKLYIDKRARGKGR